MKNDEFSFFNQQLAAMVRDGIPLESALRRLCADMRQGQLRSELEKLEADLAKGRPLREAAAARQLPDLYRQMLEVGAQSNNLPAVLTMLADHYQRRHVVWTRLKGLMVYPVIVLVGAFLLSCFLAFIVTKMMHSVALPEFGRVQYDPSTLYMIVWLAPVLIGLAAVVICVAATMPGVRGALALAASSLPGGQPGPSRVSLGAHAQKRRAAGQGPCTHGTPGTRHTRRT